MRIGSGEIAVKTLGSGSSLSGEFAQHGIDQGCCGALAVQLHQFHTLMHRGARGNPVKIEELVSADAESELYFNIKLFDRLAGRALNQLIEPLLPAQDAHYQFGCQATIAGTQWSKKIGVQ